MSTYWKYWRRGGNMTQTITWLAAVLLWVFIIVGTVVNQSWVQNVGIGIAITYLLIYRK
jgi:hypothetical protein